ncbi:MAG: 6-bladed beta-propeller [Acidobacteriota bacterium]
MVKPKLERTLLFPIVLLFIFISGSFTGCSGNKRIQSEPGIGEKYIFYPKPPVKPRYQYLTTFSTSSDIEKKKSKFFKFIAGDETKKDIVISKAHGFDISDGIIYVCDTKKRVIVTVDLKERKFGYFAVSSSVKLRNPINIKIDKSDKTIYVADNGRKEVIAFDPEGNVKKVYGRGKNYNTVDVDVYKDLVLICDAKGNQVHVMDKKTGEHLYDIGRSGHGDGDLYHPVSIAVRNKKIYISDMTNFRISIFDIEGNYIGKFGKIGKYPGQFARNKGIDVDKNGRIYVVDAAFSNVQVFNEKYQLLLFFLGPGKGKDKLYIPAEVVISYDSLEYFKQYISPGFNAEYLVLVSSNFGANKINVYAFGTDVRE